MRSSSTVWIGVVFFLLLGCNSDYRDHYCGIYYCKERRLNGNMLFKSYATRSFHIRVSKDKSDSMLVFSIDSGEHIIEEHDAHAVPYNALYFQSPAAYVEAHSDTIKLTGGSALLGICAISEPGVIGHNRRSASWIWHLTGGWANGRILLLEQVCVFYGQETTPWNLEGASRTIGVKVSDED